ncbi:MAG: hypothetical protein C0183_19135 [Roseiflexus castenholzii]|uniref:helix-turn-helix domain-containing protein n=1 Tax=Roseiflexus castenholzii TaxID=120962 RepID=UPI000CC4AB5C|nr:MAG: hypothetical protein C0183_19135 [Roseiflexus castenholzii]
MTHRPRWNSLSAMLRHALRQQEWLSLRDAAALYRVTDETMLAWVRAGVFPSRTFEGRIWVARADLEAALRRKPGERDGTS